MLLWPLPDQAKFEQLTTARARIGSARFVANGRSVVFSEARGNAPVRLLHLDRAESLTARPLATFAPGSEILAAGVGEIAVSVNRRFLAGDRFVGTLAVAPLGSSTVREDLNDIEQADWDSSGKQMAIVRSAGGRGGSSILEYPIGNKRYETSHSIQFPRLSRDGARIAFLEDTFGAAEGGHVALLDLADNRVHVLTTRFRSARGLAWSADGREIWFTAGASRANRILYAVTSAGERRVVRDAPGSVTLFDIAPDGGVLLTLDDERRSLVGARTGQAERDLSWFDDSVLAGVSDDGRWVLFSDRLGVYLSATDDSKPIRLANIDAYADALSLDGSMALATTTGAPPELVILPTKAGAQKVIPRHNITAYSGARWFPEGKRILFTGREPGRSPRSYVQSLTVGAPTPLTPEGIWVLSLDGTGELGAAIGYDLPGISIWPVAGGPFRMVPGSQPDDRPVAWTDDNKALWIVRRFEVPLQVVRLDITTGNRQIWKTLVPGDAAGVDSITEFAITPRGDAYYYSFRRLLSQLYQVRGLRCGQAAARPGRRDRRLQQQRSQSSKAKGRKTKGKDAP
jgi:hypothetical protein